MEAKSAATKPVSCQVFRVIHAAIGFDDQKPSQKPIWGRRPVIYCIGLPPGQTAAAVARYCVPRCVSAVDASAGDSGITCSGSRSASSRSSEHP
ncbi:unnamed protein product [Heligmosomoides polygyrus]|uniref:Transposase n=1 Tax=Heligmosomoides polygyrus TaxID=6339 RepID=A0A183F2U7_HELPZ|nr:unnamed protein product [Heligmosomoides polygyrus]